MRKEFETKLSRTAQNEKNLKPVYAYMKSKSRTKSGIGDIRIDPINPKSTKPALPKKSKYSLNTLQVFGLLNRMAIFQLYPRNK